MKQPTMTFNTTNTTSVVPGKDRVKEAIRRAAKKARRGFSAKRNLIPRSQPKKGFAMSIPTKGTS
jgi:hypothetical protein